GRAGPARIRWTQAAAARARSRAATAYPALGASRTGDRGGGGDSGAAADAGGQGDGAGRYGPVRTGGGRAPAARGTDTGPLWRAERDGGERPGREGDPRGRGESRALLARAG